MVKLRSRWDFTSNGSPAVVTTQVSKLPVASLLCPGRSRGSQLSSLALPNAWDTRPFIPLPPARTGAQKSTGKASHPIGKLRAASAKPGAGEQRQRAVVEEGVQGGSILWGARPFLPIVVHFLLKGTAGREFLLMKITYTWHRKQNELLNLPLVVTEWSLSHHCLKNCSHLVPSPNPALMSWKLNAVCLFSR